MKTTAIIYTILVPPAHTGLSSLVLITYGVTVTAFLVGLRRFLDRAMIANIGIYLVGQTAVATRLMRLHRIPGIDTLKAIAPLDDVVYFEHYLGAIAATAALTAILGFFVLNCFTGKGFLQKPDLFPPDVIHKLIPLALIPYMVFCWYWEIDQAYFSGPKSGHLHSHFQTWQIFWDMAGMVTYTILFRCWNAPIKLQAAFNQSIQWGEAVRLGSKQLINRLNANPNKQEG